MTMMRPGGAGGRRGGDEQVLRQQVEQAPSIPHIWRRTGALFKPYVVQLAVALAIVLVTAGLGVVPALLTQQAFDRGLFPHGGGGPNLSALWWISAAMVMILVLSATLGVVQSWLTAKIGNSVTADLRIRMFEHLQRLDLAFFTRTKTGEIQSRLQNDVGGVGNVLQNTFTSIVSNIVSVIAAVIAMFVLNWQLAVLSLVILPPLVILQRRVGQRRARIATKTQVSLAAMTAMTQEQLSVSGVLLTKTLGREQRAADEYRAANKTQVRLQIDQAMAGQRFFALVGVIMSLIPVVIYVVSGYLIVGGVSITAGTIVAFTSMNSQLTRPLMGLMRTGLDIQTSKALFARIFEYFDLAPAIEDVPNPAELDRSRIGGVSFEHVDFRYPDQEPGEPATLREVSFAVRRGEFIAFAGPSGAGKSTIAYLVSRLYDPASGVVRFAGADERQLRRSDIVDNVGMVSQESYLVHASIAENLRLAKPAATHDELVEACRKASIHDQIMTFPDGYDTVVGERGYRLSGGEKQRIAIARVLLRDPAVLILDEATSALDSVSERHVQAAIDEASRGRTVISIAHRLSTIRHADRIYVLENGEIVEQGTHEELLADGGTYAELYAQSEASEDLTSSNSNH